MSERMTNILGYLTLAAILGAIWILFGEDPGREQGARGEPTFKGLAERINETALIKLDFIDESLSLERTGDTWAVVERDGYRADTGKVRAFLRGLARSERREPKTASTDRFEQIGLGADATRIQLADDTGGSLLDISMGNRKDSANGRSLTYVFQATDTRSWLVTGLEAAPVDPTEWLDKDLLAISESRIRSVSVNGTRLQRALDDTEFQVADLAAGETMAPSYKRAEPARTLSSLSFEDVQKITNPLAEPVGQTELATHDGLIVSITLFVLGEDNWAQLSARYDSAAASEGEAGELPAAPADGAAEATALSSKTRGWLFKLSSIDADIVKQDRSDFVNSAETDAASS